MTTTPTNNLARLLALSLEDNKRIVAEALVELVHKEPITAVVVLGEAIGTINALLVNFARDTDRTIEEAIAYLLADA